MVPDVVLTKYPFPATAVKSPVLISPVCQSISDVTKVFISVKDNVPEAFVVIISLAEPSALGTIKSWLDETVEGDCKDTSLESVSYTHLTLPTTPYV